MPSESSARPVTIASATCTPSGRSSEKKKYTRDQCYANANFSRFRRGLPYAAHTSGRRSFVYIFYSSSPSVTNAGEHCTFKKTPF